MTTYLFIQLLTSFIVGGTFIALISLLAERADEKISGIIMMFPTTMVLGFFFLGVITSPNEVARIIPATITPIGIIIFSAVIYIYTAKFIANYTLAKPRQILLTFTISTVLWFMMAAPFAIFKLTNLIYGIAGYAFFIIISHILLNRESLAETIAAKNNYTKKQKLLRALFMGTMMAAIVLFSKVFNPFWGGIFTMFPVATFSALITFHFYYQPGQLFSLMKKAPIGSISLFIYTIAVMLLFPIMGLVYGSICSYLISLTFPLLLIKYQHSFKP